MFGAKISEDAHSPTPRSESESESESEGMERSAGGGNYVVPADGVASFGTFVWCLLWCRQSTVPTLDKGSYPTPPLFHRQGGSGPLSLTAQRRQ